MGDKIQLSELAKQVVETLTPIVTAEGAPRRVSLASAVASAFRPFLLHAAGEGPEPKLLRDFRDRRYRLYRVSLEFWDMERSERIADSIGREYDGNVVSMYGGETVEGLDEAAETVASYARQIALEKREYETIILAFQADDMRRAFANLRPALSRGEGRATMRRTVGRWHLICDVFRVEE
jgi:hypothetical protein